MTIKTRIVLALGLCLLSALIWNFRKNHKAAQNETAQTDGSSTDFSSWTPHRDQTNQNTNSMMVASSDREPQNDKGASARVVPSPRQHLDPARIHEHMREMHKQTSPPSALAQEIFENLPRTELDSRNAPSGLQILGAWAVPADEYSVSMGEVLREVNGYKLIAIPSAGGDGWKQLTLAAGARPVMIQPGGERLTIVTGTLKVRLRSLEDVSKVGDAENLQVLGVDEQIRTVYYKAPEGYSLLAGLKRLVARGDVESAELELYQSRKVGQ